MIAVIVPTFIKYFQYFAFYITQNFSNLQNHWCQLWACLGGFVVCPYGEQVEEVDGQPKGKGGGRAPVVGDHMGDDFAQPRDA